jgi:hypothetical protein
MEDVVCKTVAVELYVKVYMSLETLIEGLRIMDIVEDCVGLTCDTVRMV